MVHGIGIDMLEVARMERELSREGGGFRDAVFTESEVAECTAHPRPPEAFAGRFAVKEALIKAFGGTETDSRWRDLEVLCSGPDGARVVLHGAWRRRADKQGVRDIAVSFSVAGGYATAFASTSG